MGDFCMPSLGADMDAGTLIEWQVAPGAHVKRGDVIALVETQKGLIEVEIWETGTVERILVQPGARVPVGAVLATIHPDAAVARSPRRPRAPLAPAPALPHVPVPVPVPVPALSPSPLRPLPLRLPLPLPPAPSHVRASPAARQLAREHDLNLATIPATGPHGAVTRDDVARADRHAPVAPHPDRRAARTPPPPPRRPATRPHRVRRGDAQGHRRRDGTLEARDPALLSLPGYRRRARLPLARGAERARPGREPCRLRGAARQATALALRDFPELNGHFVDGEYRPSKAIHVGVAVSLRHGGLVAPAIRDTDQRSLTELMAALGDVVGRARAGTLRSSEMSDPTITVTNLGDQSADVVFGAIYPPQVALVGFGTPRERPWAENGLLGVRHVVTATLSADHRVSDGHRGARFLSALARSLDRPEDLE